MFDLFGNTTAPTDNPTQTEFSYPASLTDRYRPRTIDGFVGLAKPKAICSKLATNPLQFGAGFVFLGPSGTGKTTMAAALAEMLSAEVHHISSQNCDLATLERTCRTCNYVPMAGKKLHLVLVDEADQMSIPAQNFLLSKLDGTDNCPNTLWIFTCNAIDRFEARFLSRNKVVEFSSYGMASDAAAMLQRIWQENAPASAAAPNFARIVKDSNNNIRESLMRLETELMLA